MSIESSRVSAGKQGVRGNQGRAASEDKAGATLTDWNDASHAHVPAGPVLPAGSRPGGARLLQPAAAGSWISRRGRGAQSHQTARPRRWPPPARPPGSPGAISCLRRRSRLACAVRWAGTSYMPCWACSTMPKLPKDFNRSFCSFKEQHDQNGWPRRTWEVGVLRLAVAAHNGSNPQLRGGTHANICTPGKHMQHTPR